jgi:hypothetical protein
MSLDQNIGLQTAHGERLLRSVIRRHLPGKFHVGSGFVVTGENSSTQIDVLIVDDSGPILFRDGDFVIVTPDVVAGVIEVKSRIGAAKLAKAFKKLDYIGHIVRGRRYPPPFLGLFSFERASVSVPRGLKALQEANGSFATIAINCVALGPRRFFRFWPYAPEGPRTRYDKWHSYELEGIAFGYFIHNVLEHLLTDAFEHNQKIWYPINGKEFWKKGEIERFPGGLPDESI